MSVTRRRIAESGYIYVIGNMYFNVLKIGATTREPSLRAAELSTPTGVPGGYDVLVEERVPWPFMVERRVHCLLEKFRVEAKKEFFFCPLEEAASIVLRCAEEAREKWGALK